MIFMRIIKVSKVRSVNIFANIKLLFAEYKGRDNEVGGSVGRNQQSWQDYDLSGLIVDSSSHEDNTLVTRHDDSQCNIGWFRK